MNSDGIYTNESVMSWYEMFYNNLGLLFEAILHQIPSVWRNRFIILYAVIFGVSFMAFYYAFNFWQEFKRLRSVEDELYVKEDELAATEEELERQRQINKNRIVRVEKDSKRREAFQRVKDQIGCDENAWPVIVTNEVLALRAELTALRKAFDKQV
jgi:hypothetical protein